MKQILAMLIIFTVSCKAGELGPVYIENDFQAALNTAKTNERNILLFFTKWGCSDCSQIKFLYDQEIAPELSDYIIAILYVDDKEILQSDSISIGEINSNLQRQHFNITYTPAYFILDLNGNIIKGPIGYSSINEFVSFISNDN